MKGTGNGYEPYSSSRGGRANATNAVRAALSILSPTSRTKRARLSKKTNGPGAPTALKTRGARFMQHSLNARQTATRLPVSGLRGTYPNTFDRIQSVLCLTRLAAQGQTVRFSGQRKCGRALWMSLRCPRTSSMLSGQGCRCTAFRLGKAPSYTYAMDSTRHQSFAACNAVALRSLF